MAVLTIKIANSDGTIPLEKNYKIDDALIVHFIEAYSTVYKPPHSEPGASVPPYTQIEICERWADGLLEGSKAFVASYLRQQAQEAALSTVPDLTIT